MNLDPKEIQEAVVAKVAADMMDDWDWQSAIRSEVEKRTNAIFAERAEAIISESVDAAVKDGFERAYRRVDAFGRPTGEETTVQKELSKLVSTYWSQPVDPRTGKERGELYGSVTRAEYLMTVICAEDFSKTMKTHATNVTGHLKDGLRNQLAKHMDQMLGDLFRVKSLQDQGKVEKPY